MAIEFPADPATQTPVNEFSPTSTPLSTSNGITYKWTGDQWSGSSSGGGGGGGGGDDGYWDRTGTTLSPINAGDDVVLGTGDLSAADGTFTGNITAGGDIQSTSQNGGPLAGFRNQLINSDFRIWQRGTSFGSASGYTADRWYSGQGNINRTESSLTGSRTYRATNTGGTDSSLRQGIELPGAGLAGPFTRNSQWTLSWYAGDDSIPVTVGFGNNVSAGISSPILNGVTGTQIGSSNRRSVTFTIPDADPASTDTLFFVMLVVGGGASVAHIQLEPGPVATPYEHRPIQTELALCQRYYVQESNVDYPLFRAATDSGTSSNQLNVYTNVQFKPPMRIAPTVSVILHDNPSNQTVTPDPQNFRVKLTDFPGDKTTSMTSYIADAEL